MTTTFVNVPRPLRFGLALALAAALAGCGGSDTKKPTVASLASETASSAQVNGAPKTVSTGKAAEDELIKYVACLRKEGLNIPDPKVDAEGNLSLGSGATEAPDLDPAKLAAATKVCGNPPASALGGIDPSSPQFQDSVIKFTTCMRKQGIDVPDPDFSKGAVAAMQALGPKLASSDPKVKTAFATCRPELAAAGLGGKG
jgi:hypothetical protein